MKIYVKDREVPYKNTSITALNSKRDIDGLLAKWGVHKVAWDWNPASENGKVELRFQFQEVVDGVEVMPVIAIDCPTIWNKASRRGKHRRDSINWNVSMRVMYWYIKSHLELAHLMSSSKTTEFLPHIEVPALEGQKMKDVIIPRMNQLNELKALPDMEKIIEKTN